ncbi:Ig-like domain-containing protein, partial [Limisphaera sp. VF-2]|uniref:Ig-like domain-containing protein n=1 Tax=Limisphaera sp. VF-2 TaxID=3400418 RepID=UPI003C21B3A3
FERQGTNQWARLLGYIRQGDPGDVFALAYLPQGRSALVSYLPQGTVIRLSLGRPASSPLDPVLEILDSAGAVVASAPAGTTNLVHTVAVGASGRYFARVRANGATTGLASQYLLQIQESIPPDVVSPQIVGDSLPSEGTTSTNILDRFTLMFSEELAPATVNDAAAYELRAAGADGLFDTADDLFYSVAISPTYASGSNATCLIVDGPLQPGRYRLIVRTTLKDLELNPMASAYVRTFEVANVPGFVLENRSNDTFWGGTSLGVGGVVGADGS